MRGDAGEAEAFGKRGRATKGASVLGGSEYGLYKLKMWEMWVVYEGLLSVL